MAKQASQDDAAPMAAPAAEKFVAAVSFEGYPDGARKVVYAAGRQYEAPPEYVALLKSKGLVADK